VEGVALDRAVLYRSVATLPCRVGPDRPLGGHRVIGIDTVPEMLQKAKRNGQTAGPSNVKSLSGRADDLPLAGGSVNVIITKACST
jgi:ubiquinone/menaquinone biosynthesis C-methylase UbiE